MKNQLRDKLENAALRLDDLLSSSDAARLGKHERTLLSAAHDIAQALDLLKYDNPF